LGLIPTLTAVAHIITLNRGVIHDTQASLR
jgi:hypothetical protein